MWAFHSTTSSVTDLHNPQNNNNTDLVALSQLTEHVLKGAVHRLNCSMANKPKLIRLPSTNDAHSWLLQDSSPMPCAGQFCLGLQNIELRCNNYNATANLELQSKSVSSMLVLFDSLSDGKWSSHLNCHAKVDVKAQFAGNNNNNINISSKTRLSLDGSSLCNALFAQVDESALQFSSPANASKLGVTSTSTLTSNFMSSVGGSTSASKLDVTSAFDLEHRSVLKSNAASDIGGVAAVVVLSVAFVLHAGKRNKQKNKSIVSTSSGVCTANEEDHEFNGYITSPIPSVDTTERLSDLHEPLLVQLDHESIVSINRNGDFGDDATADGISEENVPVSTIFTSTVVPTDAKVGYTILLLLSFCLFLSSNLSTGASVIIKGGVGSWEIEPFEIFAFSLGNTIHDMLAAHVYVLALLVLVWSGCWPYMKLLLMGLAWVAPPSKLKPNTRGRMLHVMDGLGKWCMIDIFLLLMMTVAFRFHLTSDTVPDIGKHLPHSLGHVDVTVMPGYGIFGFVTAAMCSLVANHMAVAYHRNVVHYDKSGHKKKKSLSDAYSKPRGIIVDGSSSSSSDSGSENADQNKRLRRRFCCPCPRWSWFDRGSVEVVEVIEGFVRTRNNNNNLNRFTNVTTGNASHISDAQEIPTSTSQTAITTSPSTMPLDSLLRINAEDDNNTTNSTEHNLGRNSESRRTSEFESRILEFGRNVQPARGLIYHPSEEAAAVFLKRPLYAYAFPGHARVSVVVGRAAVTALLIAALVLILWGAFMDSFTFVFTGLAGELIEVVDPGAGTRSFSMVSIATALTEQHGSGSGFSPGVLFLQVVYLMFALVFPLIQVIFLLALWVVPMRLRDQKIVLFVSEVISAWASIDVFIVSLVASVAEIDQFARFLIGDRCDIIEAIIDEPCFGVKTLLLPGCWMVFAAAVALFAGNHVVFGLCEASSDERERRALATAKAAAAFRHSSTSHSTSTSTSHSRSTSG